MNTTTATQYVIRQTRHYYGCRTERSLLLGDDNAPVSFDSAAAAAAYIAELDGAVYHTAHNEAGRPEYKAVRSDKLPAYLASQF